MKRKTKNCSKIKYVVREVICLKCSPNWVQNHFQIKKETLQKWKKITKNSDTKKKIVDFELKNDSHQA